MNFKKRICLFLIGILWGIGSIIMTINTCKNFNFLGLIFSVGWLVGCYLFFYLSLNNTS